MDIGSMGMGDIQQYLGGIDFPAGKEEVEFDVIAAEVGGTAGGPTGQGPSVAAVVRPPR